MGTDRICENCGYYEATGDYRCFCEDSQWRNRFVQSDNYCRHFLPGGGCTGDPCGRSCPYGDARGAEEGGG